RSSVARYVPGSTPVASKVTATCCSPPGGTTPAVGSTSTHGVPVGASQAGGSTRPVTFITRCTPGNPMAARSTGCGKPQEAERKYDGAVCPAPLAPGQNPPTPDRSGAATSTTSVEPASAWPVTGTVTRDRVRGWPTRAALPLGRG